jgi:hypothetical protein
MPHARERARVEIRVLRAASGRSARFIDIRVDQTKRVLYASRIDIFVHV